jgi:7-cyano-7-deazaguanine synthase
MHHWGRENVFPLSFNYGQRHLVELSAAVITAERLGVRQNRMLPVSALNILGAAALTNPDITVNANAEGTGNTYAEERGLPSTFIPGRNMLFFTLGMAYAAKLGVHNLVTGVCETDRAGYPDCRHEFVNAAQRALALALDDDNLIIHAPLVHRSKAETFLLAEDLGVLDMVIEDTHTCYNGNRSNRFDWGYGCGECPACLERSRGWTEYDEDLADKGIVQ